MRISDIMYRKRFYKRSKGRARSGSTNFATATYQEIYDINTVSDDVTIIGIHTPTGSKPRQMLSGFFTQYRKYSYLGCSVIGTFAQGLPLDILSISPNAGQGSADPRDILNPILSRGCHGDNLSGALNSIYKGSFQDEGSSMGKDSFGGSVTPTGGLSWEQMYYRMLQDPSFKKYRMGSGFYLKGLRPLIYNVASNHQIMPNENSALVGKLKADAELSGDAGKDFYSSTGGSVSDGGLGQLADITPQFMTNRLQRLGWIDTKQVLNSSGTSVNPTFTVLPKIFMSCLILPKAYRVSNCMRVIISHKFAFKEFNTSLTLDGASEYYDWLSSIVPGSKSETPLEVKDNDTLEIVGGDAEIVSDGVF